MCMRRIFATLSVAALVGCSMSGGAGTANEQRANPPATPPVTPPTPPTKQAAAPDPGPCVGPISPEALEQCDFLPKERMEGVWVTGFERSEFVPGGTGAIDPNEPPVPRPWLAFAPGAYPDPELRGELDALHTTAAVAIVFDGRRARAPGQVVVVDHIISARSLGPVTPR